MLALILVLLPQIGKAQAYLTSISSNPATVPSGGLATVNVRVSEACPSGGCFVGLYSQKPALFPLPENITIPEGASSIGVPVQAAVNDTGSAQYIKIQANMNGVYRSSSLYLARPVFGPTLSSFSFNSSVGYLYSGSDVKVDIALTDVCPNDGGCAVKLSVNAGLLSFPSSLVIEKGLSSSQFSAKVGATNLATSTYINASYNGVSKSTPSVYIFPELPAKNADESYSMTGFGSSTRTGTGSVTKSMNVSMAFNNMKAHVANYVSKQCLAAIPNGVLVIVSTSGYGEYRNSNGLLQYDYTQKLKCKIP